MWICGLSWREPHVRQSWLNNQVLLLGHATWATTQHCQWLCSDPLGRRGIEMLTPEDSTTNLTFLWLWESKSKADYVFTLRNPDRSVLGVLTISFIFFFPPTFKCSYNSNNTANPPLIKQVIGFCLLFANYWAAHTKEPYLSVRASDGDTLLWQQHEAESSRQTRHT